MCADIKHMHKLLVSKTNFISRSLSSHIKYFVRLGFSIRVRARANTHVSNAMAELLCELRIANCVGTMSLLDDNSN